jgi:hypothetical protein
MWVGDAPAPEIPDLIGPALGEVVATGYPTFAWSATAGFGGNYTLQYSTDSSFTAAVVTLSDLTDTTYTPDSMLAATTWYWRVNAFNAQGSSGYPAAPSWFTIEYPLPEVPELLAPADGAELDYAVPTFTWSATAGAGGHYTLDRCDDPEFLAGIDTVDNHVDTVYIPQSDMPNGTWYWRVQATNSYSMLSGYQADPFSLTIATYVTGDLDGNELINVSDAVYGIDYVFNEGPAPNPMECGDVNCDGSVNISDVVYLIDYIFGGGPPPCEH